MSNDTRVAEAERQVRIVTAIERTNEHVQRAQQEMTRIAGVLDGGLVNRLPTEMSALREQLTKLMSDLREQVTSRVNDAASAMLKSNADAIAAVLSSFADAVSNIDRRIDALSSEMRTAIAAVAPDPSKNPFGQAGDHDNSSHVKFLDRLDGVKTRTWFFATLFIFVLGLTLAIIFILRARYGTEMPHLPSTH